MSTTVDNSLDVTAEAGVELAVRNSSLMMDIAGMSLDHYHTDEEEEITPEHMEQHKSAASSLSGRMNTLRHKVEDMNEKCRKHHRLLWNWTVWTTLILLYGCLGGLIFHACEFRNEKNQINKKKRLNENFEIMRIQQSNLTLIWPMLQSNLSELSSLSAIPDNHDDNRWHFIESMVFAFTTCSTIGYGYSSPVTTPGRTMVFVYGLPGIILYCVAFYGVGRVILDGSTLMIRKIIRGVRRMEDQMKVKVKQTETKCDDYLIHCCCFWLPEHKQKDRSLKKSDRRVQCCGICSITLLTMANIQRTFIGFFILFLVLLMGAIDLVYSQEWTFTDAFYFMFVSISTIGFGDLQPRNGGPRALIRVFVVYSGLSVLAALLSQWQDNVQKELAAIIDRSEMALVKLKTHVSQSPQTFTPRLMPKLSLTGKSSTTN